MQSLFVFSDIAMKLEIMCTKMQSIFVFSDIAKFADFRLKMLRTAELKGCVT